MDKSNSHLLRWKTQTALSEFDGQMASFDNPALECSEDEDLTLSDEDSSICLESLDGHDQSFYEEVNY